jgi:mono/diheme cytochrome c family protein
MARAADILRGLFIAGALLVLLVLVVLLYSARQLGREEPAPQLASDAEHFLYGSIGSEADGIPYWVWLVLPRVFPEYLPGAGGYASLGIDTRDGRDMPIGMSRVVRGGVPRVGINCAFCHTARVRMRPGDISTIIPGAPGHQVNWDRYRRFLIACASDPRFTGDTLLAEIDRNYRLPQFERMLYKWAIIPRTRRALLELANTGVTGDAREAGPGRGLAFGVGLLPGAGDAATVRRGAADMMAVWNLGRHRDAFYWDGANTRLPETIAAWALASGTPSSWLDRDHRDAANSRLGRIQNYLSALAPPKYPSPVNADLARVGEGVFATECASCHAAGGARTGTVIPHDQVNTDRARADAWTADAATAYNSSSGGLFTSFRKTNGYVAPPLEGVWIRGPYLHNGSVPALADLLNPPEQRPKQFWRGYDLFDPTAVGFVSSGAEAERVGMRFDTTQPGNGNGGHSFGTQLPPDTKRALLEYLKGL